MLISPKDILQAKKMLVGYTHQIEEKSKFYEIVSNPTRLKIIFLLKKHKELCATDIANVLGISISAVSHQARILESAGIISRLRMGKMICYSIQEDKIKKIISL